MKKCDFISGHSLDQDKDVVSQLCTDFSISFTEFDELTVGRQSLGDRFIITDGHLLVGERFSYLEDFIKVNVLKVLDEESDLYIEITLDKGNLILTYEVPFNDNECYRTELRSEVYKIIELPKFTDSLSFSYLEDIDDWEYIDLRKLIDEKFNELNCLRISI